MRNETWCFYSWYLTADIAVISALPDYTMVVSPSLANSDQKQSEASGSNASAVKVLTIAKSNTRTHLIKPRKGHSEWDMHT
jgi:hypothetical protein